MKPVNVNGATQALAELASLDRKALAERWADVFGCPAPHRVHPPLLRSALAWRYQIAHEAEGDVGQLIRRLTRQAASPAPAIILAAGTRLLREWHGQTHHVTVTTDGFDYGGKRYRSLSAISREITGAAWSGPSFFGLKK